ncbi:unnamed protein product [Tetraodon nigroviridis]|uniref:(spotted green pufferfish) hypothetical protein n=1 Tax=Tetraodon nigroviridis TaxID=99883 RepID=Q4SWX7_TETNG|nr:unnamed protein product [Tetraodon nigroviridis]
MDFHWPFGKFMCKLNSTVSFLNMFASVYVLVVISVDRCVSVVLPIWAQNHRSVRKASCVSLAVWVLALILSVPYFVFKDTAPSYVNDDIINCFNNYALSDDYENPSVNHLRQFRHQAMIITRFLLGEFSDVMQFVKTMSMIIYSLAFVLGVLGNGVVIWVTGFKMKTVNTVWFLNLAVADFLFTAFLPLSVTYIAMDSHWPFGKFMCKLNSMILYLNMFASVYLLVVISVDRCVSVVLARSGPRTTGAYARRPV